MKKIVLSLLLVASLSLSSCVSFMATYSVGLSTVESPADAKKQFGETKVVNFVEGDVNKYRYEDDYINVVWYVSPQQFHFELMNKTPYSIKLNWDDISFVDINGQTGRVMHTGIKYIDKNNVQPTTIIPKGAKLVDILLPTDNVYFSTAGMVGEWKQKNLFPSFYKSKSELNQGAFSYIGKKMRIMMPLMIENVQNDYVFEFNIDEFLGVK